MYLSRLFSLALILLLPACRSFSPGSTAQDIDGKIATEMEGRFFLNGNNDSSKDAVVYFDLPGDVSNLQLKIIPRFDRSPEGKALSIDAGPLTALQLRGKKLAWHSLPSGKSVIRNFGFHGEAYVTPSGKKGFSLCNAVYTNLCSIETIEGKDVWKVNNIKYERSIKVHGVTFACRFQLKKSMMTGEVYEGYETFPMVLELETQQNFNILDVVLFPDLRNKGQAECPKVLESLEEYFFRDGKYKGSTIKLVTKKSVNDDFKIDSVQLFPMPL